MPELNPNEAGGRPQMPSPFRYYGGWIFFVLAWTMPLFALVVPMLGLDKSVTTLLIGGLVVGGPELCTVLAAALWGKETLAYFIGRATGLLKRALPPQTVSPGRYRFGLALFLLSALPSWLLAYFPYMLDERTRIVTLVVADFAFIFSFYVLGGDFWGKLRALFSPEPIHPEGARA